MKPCPTCGHCPTCGTEQTFVVVNSPFDDSPREAHRRARKFFERNTDPTIRS